jgi:hypothetical protein
VYRVGDTLRVRVAKVDRARRMVDFAPAGDAPARPAKGKSALRHRGGRSKFRA